MSDFPKKVTVSITNGTIVRAILLVIGVVAFFILRDVILIVLTAIVLASFVESMVQKLKKYKISRTLAVFLVYFISIAALTALFYVFIPVLVNELSNIVVFFSKYFPSADVLGGINTKTISGAKALFSSISNDVPLTDFFLQTQRFVSKVSAGFLDTVTGAFGGIINILLIFVISFYLSIQEKGIENFLRIVIPAKYEEYTIGLWHRTERKIGLWVQGQLLLGLFIAVITYLCLAILGIQYALLLALVAGLFELIPFGIVLATIPAVAFAYMDGGVSLGLIVLGFYIILQQFEAYLIAPLIVKKIVGISPLMVIISILIGSTLAGFWGLILAVPCAVFVLELMDDLEKEKIFAKENEQSR